MPLTVPPRLLALDVSLRYIWAGPYVKNRPTPNPPRPEHGSPPVGLSDVDPAPARHRRRAVVRRLRAGPAGHLARPAQWVRHDHRRLRPAPGPDPGGAAPRGAERAQL